MKLFNAKLLKYELKSQIKNWYIPFFGLVFPIFMSQIITRNALGDVPEGILPYAHIKVFFSFAMYIPMCCVFLAHSNNYGYEVEREIPLRLKLFGIPEFTQISCRLQSVLIVSTVAIVIFCLSFFLSFETPKPSISIHSGILSSVHFAVPARAQLGDYNKALRSNKRHSDGNILYLPVHGRRLRPAAEHLPEVFEDGFQHISLLLLKRNAWRLVLQSNGHSAAVSVAHILYAFRAGNAVYRPKAG